MIVERFGLSERRACLITGQHRSTQRHQPPRGGDRDDALRERLRRLSAEHPRWGYRLAWGAVREEGWAVNRKKVQRLWREEGLRVPQEAETPPARRLDSAGAAAAFRATEPRLGPGLPVRHHHRREDVEAAPRRRRAHPRGLGDPGRPLDRPDHAVRVLDQIVRERGTAPELVRMDNGPELTANALRDWCRLGGSGRSFIEPGSPWQNPFVESFGSRVRDEVLWSKRSTPCSRRKQS